MPQHCPKWAPRLPAYPESYTNTLKTSYHITPYAPTLPYMTIDHMGGSLLDINILPWDTSPTHAWVGVTHAWNDVFW